MTDRDDGVRHSQQPLDPMPPAIPERLVLVTTFGLVGRVTVQNRRGVILIVLADVVEDQIVLRQDKAERQRQQEREDAREDVRLLHLSGESSVTGTIPCCYVCNRSRHLITIEICLNRRTMSVSQ